ncbi:hypothetical protein ACFP1Z_12845 [Streptomyces gamaensis]|uniref:Uncharacterized protein n=1 Tax=Streptomyces gamaensis TaxID=1763542 RepID=A0ABW0YWT2_9ACTN
MPAGKVLVVEHISGSCQVGENDVVDQILVQDDTGEQSVFLPVQFASSPIFAAGNPAAPRARSRQFGSPVRLYIANQSRINVNAGAGTTGNLDVAIVGQFVDV